MSRSRFRNRMIIKYDDSYYRPKCIGNYTKLENVNYDICKRLHLCEGTTKRLRNKKDLKALSKNMKFDDL